MRTRQWGASLGAPLSRDYCHFEYFKDRPGELNGLREFPVETTKLENGVWHVKEYQPARMSWNDREDRFLDSGPEKNGPQRWQLYPEAGSEDEARALAKVRYDKELKNFKRRWFAIERKCGVPQADAAVDAAHNRHFKLRGAIARARVTGPIALVIKLGVLAKFNDDDIGDEAGEKLYRYAVEQAGGYDPIAELNRLEAKARQEWREREAAKEVRS